MGRRWLTISLSLLVMLALAAGARYIIVVDDEDLEESDLERIKRIALGTEEIAGRFVFRDAPAPDLGFVLAWAGKFRRCMEMTRSSRFPGTAVDPPLSSLY